MDKTELLSAIRRDRERWDALLAEVPQERMAEPGLEGEWSLKDVIAHITWHEREMVGLLRARALVGSELWGLPTDQRNAAIYEENRHRSLSDLLEESRRVYAELLQELEKLSDEELNDAQRFAEMPPDWLPWKVIAENSYEHYQDHERSVRAWLRSG